ncbi:MAG: DotH/IcmK family type IV secretion protein [Proteobacteria bacterium]|nr:DotH/IcmK family type IV secretion protein [Pseudomonadota bacterium]
MKKVITSITAFSLLLAGIPVWAADNQELAALFGAQAPAQPAAAPVPVSAQSQNQAGPNSSLGATDVSQEAFSKTARQMMPLTPEQIKTLRYLFDQTQKAAASDPGDKPPKPTSSSMLVNLSPGAAPPVIRLRAGYITSLVFLDSTGEPWPIQAYDLGNPKSFNIRWDQKSNTLMVQAVDTYQAGNLAVILKDHNTPVMLTLMPGQHEVDYRVDLRLPSLGPNAAPSITGLPDTGNSQLLNFLDGVPPAGSKELIVAGGSCQAWVSGDRLFLRTRLTVLSPSWLSTMRSPDGTNVYEMTKAPVILASANGRIVQLNIKGL